MPENPDYQPWPLGGPLCRIYEDLPEGEGRRRCVIHEEITAGYLESLPDVPRQSRLLTPGTLRFARVTRRQVGTKTSRSALDSYS